MYWPEITGGVVVAACHTFPHLMSHQDQNAPEFSIENSQQFYHAPSSSPSHIDQYTMQRQQPRPNEYPTHSEGHTNVVPSGPHVKQERADTPPIDLDRYAYYSAGTTSSTSYNVPEDRKPFDAHDWSARTFPTAEYYNAPPPTSTYPSASAPPDQIHPQGRTSISPKTVAYSPEAPENYSRTSASPYNIDSANLELSHLDQIPSPSDTNTRYSFVPLPSNAPAKKRPRRRYDEIERLYGCNFENCTKAYGTLNHLNAHITMQKHGPKRDPNGRLIFLVSCRCVVF